MKTEIELNRISASFSSKEEAQKTIKEVNELPILQFITKAEIKNIIPVTKNDNLPDRYGSFKKYHDPNKFLAEVDVPDIRDKISNREETLKFVKKLFDEFEPTDEIIKLFLRDMNFVDSNNYEALIQYAIGLFFDRFSKIEFTKETEFQFDLEALSKEKHYKFELCFAKIQEMMKDSNCNQDEDLKRYYNYAIKVNEMFQQRNQE